MKSFVAVALLFSVAALQLTSAAEVCAGCPVDADPEVVKEVTPMVHAALKKFNANLGNPHELLKVTHVKTQVVAGIKYMVDMETVGGQDKVVRKCSMVLLSQPWINKEPQMLSFTCQDKAKRALLGGLKSVPDSEMDSVKELANYAVKTLDDIDADDQMRVVEEILDAKKQLVNGVMYHLKLIVKVTSCKEGKLNDDCLNSEVSERKLCSLNIHRSWADKSPLNAKVVKSECEPMLGAPVESDHNNEYIKRMAQFAVNHVSNKINSIYQQGLVRILKATTQIVAGYNVHLTLEVDETDCKKSASKPADVCSIKNSHPQICDVRVYDNPWMKETYVTMAECYPKRVKRALVGGQTDIDPSDAGVREIALFAVSDIDSKSNSGDYKFGLGEIIEAKKQVVSGQLYTIKMSLGLSSCQKSSNDDKCFSTNPHMICTVKVWDQPWLHKKTVESSTCEDKRSKRAFLGGEKVIEVDDAKIPELKSYLGEELTSRSNSPFKKTVVKFLEVKTQVVSGTLTKVTAEVADTTCLKTDNKEVSECQDNNQSHQVCTITIWDQPWIGKKEITHSECHATHGITATSREKRSPYEDSELLELSEKFEDFKRTYNKTYSTPEEHAHRFRVFRANMLVVKKLQETEQGTATYGPTQFADLTKSEFKRYLGFNGTPTKNHIYKSKKLARIPNIELPTEFDWRDHGAVTEVKNQGSCGSCWAFSVTGNIEGQYAIKNKKLISLSEQELVDCDSYDNGCNGGLFDTAFHAIEDMGGLETESDYPYTGVQSNTCKFNRSEIRVSISGSVNISTDENDMAKWLVKNGPISIAINANAMQFYMGGVSHPLKFLCNPKNLDHGVLIVGFGVHKGTWFHRNKEVPYWIVKNSWGQRWGRQGYYLLYRGGGTCGVNQMPTSSTLDD